MSTVDIPTQGVERPEMTTKWSTLWERVLEESARGKALAYDAGTPEDAYRAYCSLAYRAARSGRWRLRARGYGAAQRGRGDGKVVLWVVKREARA